MIMLVNESPPASSSPWLTRRQAAERAQVDPKTIDRWVRDGRLTRHGKRRGARFKIQELDAAISWTPTPQSADREG